MRSPIKWPSEIVSNVLEQCVFIIVFGLFAQCFTIKANLSVVLGSCLRKSYHVCSSADPAHRNNTSRIAFGLLWYRGLIGGLLS